MKVLLDAGHGADTPGKRSPVWADGTQFLEWEFTRDIVLRIAKHLPFGAYRLLVPEAWDVPLKERCRRANAEEDCFVLSIHANAGGGTGYEVWTSRGKTKSDEYASVLFEEMQKEFFGERMRSDFTDGDADKETDFYILKHTRCPAILSECFFMDNEKDCRKLMSSHFRERIAKAHAKFILKIIQNET